MPRRPSKPGSDDDPAAARARALRLLTRREHGAKELAHKLTRRGVSKERAATVVGELAQAGWQSDTRYVEILVRSRVAQGYGPLRVEAELEAAGVADELIRTTLAACETDWKQLAVELHARKFGSAPIKAADWQKQYRFFAARGFDADQIRAALRREPPEDFE